MYINRSDIIARIFRTKLKRLIYFIRIRAAFGLCRVYIYTVKYQKRGLFYAYIIVFIYAGHAFSEPEYINNLIRAKLPNRQLDSNESLTIIIK